MKTFNAIRQHREQTIKYRFFPAGIEMLKDIHAEDQSAAIHNIVQEYDDANYFPQLDGSIKDCDGNVIYKPGDETADLGDYFYEVEEV